MLKRRDPSRLSLLWQVSSFQPFAFSEYGGVRRIASSGRFSVRVPTRQEARSAVWAVFSSTAAPYLGAGPTPVARFSRITSDKISQPAAELGLLPSRWACGRGVQDGKRLV
jgi:hypothetical protein